MLKINLLPESARKVSLSPLQQFHRTPLMLVVAGGMVAGVLLPMAPIALRRQQLQQLRAKIQALAPKKAEMDQLQRMSYRLQAQEAAFKQFGKGQELWSQRLNVLSNVTPDGVWFTELSLDQEKGLIIQGLAISQGGGEMVGIGRLVQDLKNSPAFASALKGIQIDSIKRAQEKDVELVQFTLTCRLAEAPAS